MFANTKTYQRRRNIDRTRQIQFDAALDREARELTQPWPAIAAVRSVTFRPDMSDAANVVIDVEDGQGCLTTRVRNAQDAITEAAGYAMRAGWNYNPVLPLPAAFVDGFLKLQEAMPAEAVQA